MKRGARLLELMQILKSGPMVRAADIAAQMGVSQRTVYRDMETLMASGVPVVGTRGTGYRVTAAITLPPINLSLEELEALQMGLAAVGQSGDPALEAAAASLWDKLDAALPEDTEQAPSDAVLAIYPFADAAKAARHLPLLRQAIRAKQKVQLRHGGIDHTARPLRIDFWGRVWSLLAWSETTRDFTELRVDQIERAQLLPQLFVDETGKTLADYR